jgi:hypothetical protein
MRSAIVAVQTWVGPSSCHCCYLTVYNGGYGVKSDTVPWKVGVELELGQMLARVAALLCQELVTAAGSGSDHVMAPKRFFLFSKPPLAESGPADQIRRLQRPCKAQNPSVVTRPQNGAGVWLLGK